LGLATGTKLGSYEIVGPIGAGGMGEVYRANDTTLGRDVALKILPESFAADPDRSARFAREARTLAALNHPNIAHVYGLEGRAFVMELVEGEDLSQRLARGSMPLAEALPIARQIADALECAHEAGIIHRDLKPANIKIRDDGTVKVLDFGLAKAFAVEDASHAEAMHSPTLTNRATALGVVLGTAAYMAPEQARGKPVDRRADVWAFGVVLFEMLTGRRLFDGGEISDTLAAVLTRDPQWSDLPAATPPAIRRLLARCLAKERRARLDSMAGARLEIDEALAAMTVDRRQAGDPSDTVRLDRPALHRARSSMLVAGVAAVALAAAWLLATWLGPVEAGRPLPSPVVSSVLAPPDAISAFNRGFALSPDGRTLVLSARAADGSRALWKRPLSQPHFERLPGTEGALYPFWSPDSTTIGFFADGSIKRVGIDGGPAQTIWAGGSRQWASWSEHDAILFSVGPGRGPQAGIYKIAASGGAPEKLAVDGDVLSIGWLPGGNAFLFVRREAGAARLWAATADASREPRAILDLEPHDPGAAISPSGVIFFNRAGVLNAQQFETASFQFTGVARAIGAAAGTPRTWFGASAADDSLLVLAGPTAATGGNPGDPLSRLRWVDREGRVIGNLGPPGRYWTHRLSPDGRRAVVNPDKDLWIVDATTGLRSRLTVGPSSITGGIWAPDGRRLLYQQTAQLWVRPIDGRGGGEQVAKSSGRPFTPLDWSLDGSRVLLSGMSGGPTPSIDVFLWTVGEPEPKPFLNGEFREGHARFSPDGRWVAFVSDLTGRLEVYLRAIDGDDGAVRLSSDGGEHPQWRRDGRELFYLTPTDEVVAVDLSRFEQSRVPGPQQKLFRLVMNDIIRETFSPFDVSPDARRFLVNVPEPSEPLTLIQGFHGLLAPRRGGS
jgi:serine/threonine protein kinase